MVRYPLLHSLFDNDLFIEPNFDRWYQKLRIVLEHEWILNMIIDPALDVPTSDIHDAIKGTYQKWPNDHIMVWYFLRAVKNINLVINLMMLSEKKFFKY